MLMLLAVVPCFHFTLCHSSAITAVQKLDNFPLKVHYELLRGFSVVSFLSQMVGISP